MVLCIFHIFRLRWLCGDGLLWVLLLGLGLGSGGGEGLGGDEEDLTQWLGDNLVEKALRGVPGAASGGGCGDRRGEENFGSTRFPTVIVFSRDG